MSDPVYPLCLTSVKAHVAALVDGIELLARGLRDRDEPRGQLAVIAEGLVKDARAALAAAEKEADDG